MNDYAAVILEKYQVRKSKKDKEHFRNWLISELRSGGYAPYTEEGRTYGVRYYNVVAGDPEKARILITAHYDTCAVLPIPNFITPRNFGWYLVYQLLMTAVILVLVGLVMTAGSLVKLPLWAVLWSGYAALIFCIWWIVCGKANRHTANDNTSGVITVLAIAMSLPENLRNQVCFVFFDNEERGLLGSAAFARVHEVSRKKRPVLNFDCVGDGDYIQFYPSKQAKKMNEKLLSMMEKSYSSQWGKNVDVVRSFSFYPSDQAQFVNGIGICALKKSGLFGYYMDRIHTDRDTVLDKNNVELLREGTVKLLLNLCEKEDSYAG